MTKKNTILNSIISELDWLDIAWYLKEEMSSLLKYLHYYKLKNIHQNIDALKEYLNLLDCHSTQQINSLVCVVNEQLPEIDNDLLYYVSKRGLDIIWDKALCQKIYENQYDLSYAMQAVKWFLLLTADEFCNASPTRMSINRMLWKDQFVKKKAYK